MKLPANAADVRMGQLLQRIQTNFEMVKDEESRLRIIELLLYVSNVIQSLIKAREVDKNAKLCLKLHIEEQLDGYSRREEWKSNDYDRL